MLMKSINERYKNERGDLLIFVSGMQDISTLLSSLEAIEDIERSWILLPLHGSLSLSDQEKVFHTAGHNMRKCIISTNIAETSMTIDGIRFVIDSGKVKEMTCDLRHYTYKLKQVDISKASAEQRKGRAGRTGPGECYRLYSEQQYENFAEYTLAAIHRSNLDQMVLQLFAIGLSSIDKFPFLEQPEQSRLEQSITILHNHNAMVGFEITILGRLLALLPVEISIGKALVYSSILNISDKAIVMTSLLSISTIFTGIVECGSSIDMARRSIQSSDGDPFVLYECIQKWLDMKIEGENTKRWCRKYGIEESRFYEVIKLRRQFEDIMTDNKISDSTLSHRSHVELNDYRTAKNKLQRLKRQHHFNQNDVPKPKLSKNRSMDETYEHMQNKQTPCDIEKLEFDLTSNSVKILDSMAWKKSSKRLMRLLLAVSFYPNFALGDESNSHLESCEFNFHLKDRQFLSIHPTSLVQFDSSYFPKGSSNAHTVISFESLLETNKPYLVNVVPAGALITCLLVCKDIATNCTCRTILFDGWIKIQTEANSISLIGKSIICRQIITELILSKLDAFNESKNSMSYLQIEMQKALLLLLDEIYQTTIDYTMKRLSYVSKSQLYKKDNGKNRGGSIITEYFEFDCLLEIDSQMNETGFECSLCKSVFVNVQMFLKHCSCCHKTIFEPIQTVEKTEEPVIQTCDQCGFQFEQSATAMDILRHRKLCIYEFFSILFCCFLE